VISLAASAAAAAHELPKQALGPLPDAVTAQVIIYPEVVRHPVSPVFIGTNLTQYKADKQQIAVAATRQRVRGLGIRSVRFPNGCFADRYNWLNPPTSEMTVEEFLDFCDAIKAEPYYTLNMQGGTEGLDGEPAKDAPLEDRIRYRHKAPNPCGYTDYYFGTLAEAVALVEKHTIERARQRKTPLIHFELGNENWGQAKSDWPPDVYGKTCEVYASTLRKTLADAQKQHPELANLSLYITMVGYPTMGNNMDPFKAVDRSINLAWTTEVNRLAALKLIDAVQEHFYPFGNNNGDTLYWAVHNLHNILALRYGQANDRLKGYQDPELAYHLPIEFTEWNVKCWGTVVKTDLKLENAGFETGLRGWTVEASPADTGSATATAQAARRGKAGLELKTVPNAQWVEVRQKFSVADRKPAALFGCGFWIKTDHPLQIHGILRQTNPGEHQNAVIDDRVATQTRMWERLIVAGKPFDDTTEIEIAIRLTGEKLTACLDEFQPIHWTTTSGLRPLVADHFEQQLFLVDAIREMLEWPTPRTHFHHLFGNYGCPTLSADGSERDNAKSFRLVAGRIGDVLVRTDCQVPALDYDTYADQYATDFNGLAPDIKGIPALAVSTTRRGRDLYLLMINRTTDRPITAQIAFNDAEPTGKGDLRTLSGTDLDVQGAKWATRSVKPSNPMNHTVPPLTAQVMRVTLSSGPTSSPTAEKQASDGNR
jgi:alpha-L-arabinofuranosidase